MRGITSGMSQWKMQRCSGKNLLEFDSVSFTATKYKPLQNVIPAGTYTISGVFDNDNPQYGSGIIFYFYNMSSASGNMNIPKGRFSRTITFTSDVVQISFYATGAGATNAGVHATYTNLQIERGSVATAIEPYCGGSSEHFSVANAKGGFFSVLPDYGLRVEGETAQDGTPTPDNPLPIRCVKAGTIIKVVGKNLFDKTHYDDGHFLQSANGLLSTAPGKNNLGDWACTDYIQVSPNAYYVKSGSIGGGTTTFYDANHVRISHGARPVGTAFVTPANCAYVKFNLKRTSYPWDDVQFEAGQVATTYEPYVAACEVVTPCDLFDGDVWFPMTGRVEHAKKRIEFDGTETTWIKSAAYPGGYYMRWSGGVLKNCKSGAFLCSHAPCVTKLNNYAIGTVYSDGSCNIRLFDNAQMPTVNAWEAYLAEQSAAGTPVTIVCTLATPIIEHYDPQPIFAPTGTVNVLQSPQDMPAKLSATMMIRR